MREQAPSLNWRVWTQRPRVNERVLADGFKVMNIVHRVLNNRQNVRQNFR